MGLLSGPPSLSAEIYLYLITTWKICQPWKVGYFHLHVFKEKGIFYPVHKCSEYKTVRTFKNTFLLRLIHFLKGQLIYSCDTFFPIRKIMTGACTAEPLHLALHRGARQEPRTRLCPQPRLRQLHSLLGVPGFSPAFPGPPHHSQSFAGYAVAVRTALCPGVLTALLSLANTMFCCSPFSLLQALFHFSPPCPLYSDFFSPPSTN